MKQIISFWSILFVTSLLFTSCIMYHPQAVDIPLIRHKNDLQIEGAFSITPLGFSPAINATTTYGFNEWGAIQGHINWNGQKNFYLQTAFGSYLPIKKYYVIEGYVGYGFGYSYFSNDNSDNINSTRKYSGIYHSPFLQFNTGWVGLAKEHIDLGIGIKSSCFVPNFSEIKKNDEVLYHKKICPLIEPQIFIRFGGKKLKCSLQAGYCSFFEKGTFIYDPFNVSIGISYKFELKR